MTVWRMRIACWMPEATNTHSEYVILISFPLQQWLHERASMLRYITSSVLLYVIRVLFYLIYLVLVIFMNCFAFLIMWLVND
jgi:hypothetical protein